MKTSDIIELFDFIRRLFMGVCNNKRNKTFKRFLKKVFKIKATRNEVNRTIDALPFPAFDVLKIARQENAAITVPTSIDDAALSRAFKIGCLDVGFKYCDQIAYRAAITTLVKRELIEELDKGENSITYVLTDDGRELVENAKTFGLVD